MKEVLYYFDTFVMSMPCCMVACNDLIDRGRKEYQDDNKNTMRDVIDGKFDTSEKNLGHLAV